MRRHRVSDKNGIGIAFFDRLVDSLGHLAIIAEWFPLHELAIAVLETVIGVFGIDTGHEVLIVPVKSIQTDALCPMNEAIDFVIDVILIPTADPADHAAFLTQEGIDRIKIQIFLRSLPLL